MEKLEVHVNVKCRKCNKGGATKLPHMDDFGLCLECVAKSYKGDNMKIGNVTKGKAIELVDRLFEAYVEKMDQAFSEFGNKLSINLGVVFETEKDHGIKVTAKIKFVEKEVKGELSEVVDENQLPIEF